MFDAEELKNYLIKSPSIYRRAKERTAQFDKTSLFNLARARLLAEARLEMNLETS
jgi:hypothetical protein